MYNTGVIWIGNSHVLYGNCKWSTLGDTITVCVSVILLSVACPYTNPPYTMV